MILAEYKCGCTWVGHRRECLEYCGKHGGDRCRMHPYHAVPKNEQGWDYEISSATGRKKNRKRGAE
jgi:hypothetical protein